MHTSSYHLEDISDADLAGRQFPLLPEATIIQVVTRKDGTRVGLFVMRGSTQPYATGIVMGPSGWMWGHYFDDINAAVADWLERIV